VSVIDDLVANNAHYVARRGQREMATEPQLHLAVLTCMDSRLDLFGALGLDLGQVHLIRNAGGIATDDAVRSLLLSQRLLSTRSIMVIHHTRCGSRRSRRSHCNATSSANSACDRPFDSAPTRTCSVTFAKR